MAHLNQQAYPMFLSESRPQKLLIRMSQQQKATVCCQVVYLASADVQ